jgi:hypothetical protein
MISMYNSRMDDAEVKPRRKPFQLTMTPDERMAFGRMAEAAHMSLGAWLRQQAWRTIEEKPVGERPWYEGGKAG